MAKGSTDSDLSLVTLVLFFALGVLVVLMIVIFAKRQIMRFALRSGRKPHANIGSGAPNNLREKIHQCLEKTKTIYHEPTLLTEDIQNAASATENYYYYRMKALDAFTNAVTTLQWEDSSVPRREARQTIQLFLYCLCPSAAGGKDAVLIEKFARLYKWARHSPVVFAEKEFIRYMELLDKIIRLIKTDQKRRSKASKSVYELEAQMKGAKGAVETVLTDISAGGGGKVESIPLETLHHRSSRGAGVGHQGMGASCDKSSGYSSNDRSSTGRASDEHLLTAR